ncbi:hypothetical protein GWK36_05390 [Caldichromatium japonicum]|uniref:Lipoprotein n=1 Tax=Caldichromatium japonicum TaxID=2699430 RepID=A0A6G7VC12_9GAMM|nr:hypothetical protein [Caldichromatium japonicum]QIK37504.1 hypothetical protein GWK36_05390 [Caldichromatium japonicum]
MLRHCALAFAPCIFLAGCMPPPPPPGYLMPLAQSVSPESFGNHLCRHLDLEDYSGCVSEVMGYFETPIPDDVPYGRNSNAGPIALILGQEIYLGRYDASPFVTSFWVNHGAKHCEGNYDAFAGATQAILEVQCSDGRRGRADLGSALDGRSGIGVLRFADGTRGEIVYGYQPLGQAIPYRYVSWTPPAESM